MCISGLASSQEIFRGRLKFEQPCLFAVHSIKGHAYIFTLGSSWTEQSSFIHDTVLGQSDPRENRCQTSGKTISPSPVKTQGVVQSSKGHSFIFTLGSYWTVQARPHIKIVTCIGSHTRSVHCPQVPASRPRLKAFHRDRSVNKDLPTTHVQSRPLWDGTILFTLIPYLYIPGDLYIGEWLTDWMIGSEATLLTQSCFTIQVHDSSVFFHIFKNTYYKKRPLCDTFYGRLTSNI